LGLRDLLVGAGRRRLGFAVAAAAYTWASRGETLVPTLAAQTGPPRFVPERPLTRPVYLSGLRPLHLCGTRLKGGHQGLSRRYRQREGEPLAWVWPPNPAVEAVVRLRNFRLGERLRRRCAASRGPARPARWGRPLAMAMAIVMAIAMATGQQPKRRCFVGSTRTNLRDGKSLRCPPSRRVPHKWSGRRPIRTWAALAAFPFRTRRTCLSSEGGHRRLCASSPQQGGRRRLCLVPKSKRRSEPTQKKSPAFAGLLYRTTDL